MNFKRFLASGFLIFLLTTNALHGGVSKLVDGVSVQLAPPEKQTTKAQVSIPISIEGGMPLGLVLFNVGIDSSRLAVLSQDILKIYRPEGSVLVEEFSLSKTEAEEWGELEVFPSPSPPPGVVLYRAEDYSRSGAKVICWVKGQWQTVFEGSDVDFVDIDLDGIPEIFTEEREHANGPPGLGSCVGMGWFTICRGAACSLSTVVRNGCNATYKGCSQVIKTIIRPEILGPKRTSTVSILRSTT